MKPFLRYACIIVVVYVQGVSAIAQSFEVSASGLWALRSHSFSGGGAALGLKYRLSSHTYVQLEGLWMQQEAYGERTISNKRSTTVGVGTFTVTTKKHDEAYFMLRRFGLFGSYGYQDTLSCITDKLSFYGGAGLGFIYNRGRSRTHVDEKDTLSLTNVDAAHREKKLNLNERPLPYLAPACQAFAGAKWQLSPASQLFIAARVLCSPTKHISISPHAPAPHLKPSVFQAILEAGVGLAF